MKVPTKRSQKRTPSPQAAPKPAPASSQKLTRTLAELETAFSDWESLGAVAAPIAPTKSAKSPDANEKDFRKKTRKLLSQLRKQLNEL